MHANDARLAALSGLVTIAVAALPHLARAAEQHVTCPASVDAKQVQVRAGLTGLSGPVGTLQFQGAEAIFAFGPLRDAAWGELKDPPTAKKGDTVIAKYELPTDADKYVVCHYGGRFYQAVKLPSATTECDVVYSPDRKATKGRKVNYRVTDVICR